VGACGCLRFAAFCCCRAACDNAVPRPFCKRATSNDVDCLTLVIRETTTVPLLVLMTLAGSLRASSMAAASGDQLSAVAILLGGAEGPHMRAMHTHSRCVTHADVTAADVRWLAYQVTLSTLLHMLQHAAHLNKTVH
jgi:hypothetical protein